MHAKWVVQTLSDKGVGYKQLHHRPTITANEVAEAEHLSGKRVAKVVAIIADGKPLLLILPANQYVLLHKVRELVGASYVRFASEGEMQFYFSDCDVGAIPPLRHWKNIDVIMDHSMKVDGDIVFQAGSHDEAIEMKFSDWFNIVRPRVESFSSHQKTLGKEIPYRNGEDQWW